MNDHLRMCICCSKRTEDKPFPIVCGSLSEELMKMPREEMSSTPASPREQGR